MTNMNNLPLCENEELSASSLTLSSLPRTPPLSYPLDLVLLARGLLRRHPLLPDDRPLALRDAEDRLDNT